MRVNIVRAPYDFLRLLGFSERVIRFIPDALPLKEGASTPVCCRVAGVANSTLLS
jgi:hypothetical protein